MASTNYEVHGGAATYRALDNIKSAIANKIVNESLMKQGSRTNKVARGYCFMKKLRASIGVVRRAAKKRGQPGIVVIGPRKGFDYITKFGEPRNPAKYGRIVENGRRSVTLPKIMANRYTGQVFGKSIAGVSPRPFMKPAWQDLASRGPKEIADEIADGIARAVVKYAAKGKSIR